MENKNTLFFYIKALLIFVLAWQSCGLVIHNSTTSDYNNIASIGIFIYWGLVLVADSLRKQTN